MSNINSLNKTIGELEDKIARLNRFYEEQARLLESNKDSANYSSLQRNSYIEEESLTKELGGSLETFYAKLKTITESGLKNIEERLENHNLKKNEIFRKDYETDRRCIEEHVENESRKRKLLLALDKEYHEKVLKLEEQEYEKRKNLVKKSLAGENQTVFEQLNERFEKELKEYEEFGLSTLELEKAYNKKRAKLALDQTQQVVNAISNLVNAGEAQVKDIGDTWAVINQGAHDYGRVIGLTAAQIENLNEKTLSFWSDNNIAYQFNMGLDEFYKVMGVYNKELGRAVALTQDSMLNLVSMKNVLGEEQAIKFTANLDKFGLDIDATKELVEGIVGDARRSGLVLSNLSQIVADNMYLAQQYTFEDGIEGLVKMAEKAAAVKWNMQQTAAFAEKVNNVEGAIKTGAQLSVLGGPFAQFSDPMGMLYESLNDMEGLQDRLFAMFGQLGEWNQEKGMLDISVFDKQRIRAASAAMGLNYGDVINTVQSQARRNLVMSQIEGLGLDENATELVANTAQIDRETGRAYVMYKNNKVFADEIGSHEDRIDILRELGIQANDSDENLRDIARNTLGAKELAEAAVKEVMVDKADFYQYMGVSKEGYQSTVHAIEQTKAVLNQVNMILGVISSTVALIASFSAFRGIMGGTGGTSVVGGVGAKGSTRAVTGGATTRGSATPMVGGARGANGLPAGTKIGKNGQLYWDKGNAYGKSGIVSNADRARMGYKPSAGKVGSTASGGGFGTAGMAATMAVGIGGSLIGGAMNNQAENLRAQGLHDDADAVNLGGDVLSRTAQGAAMGMMFGPWGALIGGIGGAIWGLVEGIGENNEARVARAQDERIKNLLDEIYEKTGIILYGDYEEDELSRIRGGKVSIGTSLRRKMEEQDPGKYDKLPERFARGGLIRGRSHANGGTIIEAEKDEFVVNAKSTQKNLPLLRAINDDNIRPSHITKNGEGVSTPGDCNHHVSFDSLNVNMNGDLQLSFDGGNMSSINANELLSNPSFINGIRDEIIKQVNYTTDKSFRKDNFYKKF